MIIRKAKPADKEWVSEMHNKFFNSNEPIDLFDGSFSCPFVIEEDGEIVLAGGVKTLAEVAIVTDRNKNIRTRVTALLQALGSSITIAREMNQQCIYAFVNDDDQYVKHLQKYNFKLIDAKLLVLNLGD